jgi:RNA polymerase sigma-70 factor (ECF subfamily)
MPDRDLVDSAERDPAQPDVVATLVANHRRFLAFLERRVGSRDVAEDLLQDAFVKGIERAGELRDGESAVAWFYRVLRNALVDHYRRRDSEARAVSRAVGETDEAVEPVDAELFDAACRCIWDLLDTIKPDYAAALRRVDLDGASLGDYAGEAGITANNAGVRLHRARAALRKQVIRSCATCATHGCLDCHCGNPAARR